MAGGWLVVGLGNPGPGYQRTRHNAGSAVVALLADRLGSRWRPQQRRRSDVAVGRLEGVPDPLVLARPWSYMNDSGGPVVSLAAYYKIALDRIVVVHDELDLDYGVVRLKLGGGNGGHNGIRSLIQALGSADFARVRVGIGRPPGRVEPASFVLTPFSSAERRELPTILERAADAVETLVRDGIARAQQQFHS